MAAWGSFVPRCSLVQLAESLQATGAFAPDQAHVGSVTDACVIFADASGFTALTEQLDALPNGAEVMCAIMNGFLGTVIEVVHAHGGDVIKFAGDALSCMFKVASSAGEESAEDRPEVSADLRTAVLRAACCTLELHRRLHNYVAYTDPASGKTLHLSLHIGIGCGKRARGSN
eukprot:4662992-Prymnesium_polylepis.2